MQLLHFIRFVCGLDFDDVVFLTFFLYILADDESKRVQDY